MELVKQREKKLREENLKQKFVFGKDKAIWFAKIQDLQKQVEVKAQLEDHNAFLKDLQTQNEKQM